MRKILIIFTLMVSSFFLFNTGVKADTFNYILDDKDFNYLNSTFDSVRELAVAEATSTNQYYIIAYMTDKYLVYFFEKKSFQYELNNNYIRLFMSATFKTYKYNKGELVSYAQYNSIYKELINTNYANKFSYFQYLDTNIESHTCEESGHTFSLTYNDFTYTFTSEDNLPSLYQFKTIMENPPVEEEPEEPELPRNDSLDSFYSLIIEKIQLFANNFITNDVLLFILGIFVLIFISELIFRRLL